MLKSYFYLSISNYSYYFLKDIDIYITSHGGVGTTFLIDYIANHKKVNDSSSFKNNLVKHLPKPPRQFGKNLKIIYVFGDPVLATLSLFQRNYAYLQCHKNGSYSKIYKETSLDEYISSKQDKLALTKNFFEWSKNPTTAPILYINYSKIWQYKYLIADFIEVPNSSFHDFPIFQERSSSLNMLTENQISTLREVYSDYYNLMGKIGDVKIGSPPV